MQKRSVRGIMLVFSLVLLGVTHLKAQTVIGQWIRPATADSRVGNSAFKFPNLVLSPLNADQSKPLVVYLPSTGGKASMDIPLLRTIARQGFQVIGLTYNSLPSVIQQCSTDPNPKCSGDFRQMRVFGDVRSDNVSNTQAESIVSRLASLLNFLSKKYPGQGWDRFVTTQGDLVWSKIILSGHSQGAGMAAYMAKRLSVARVVLFSGPSDWTGADKKPAPWLSDNSATPADLWWAERHSREILSDNLAAAYSALGISKDHILTFDKDLMRGATRHGRGADPFHYVTVLDGTYAPQWYTLFGIPNK